MEQQITKAVLVDDDPYAVESLRDLLKTMPQVEVVAAFTQPEEAVAFIKKFPPDVVFLDIQMPGMSGFEMLDALGTDVPEIIFVTAHNQYAITAIRYSALDYLLKPVARDDLRNSLERFNRKTEKILTQSKLLNLKHNLSAQAEQDFDLVLTTKSEGEHRFRSGDIIRCEADSNYTGIYLKSGKRFLASKTLGDLEVMLSPACFVRIHKSHIINTSYVEGFTKNHEVTMTDQSLLPISKRRFQEVKQLLSH